MSTPEIISPESYEPRYEEKRRKSPIKTVYGYGGEVVTKVTSVVDYFCRIPEIATTAIEGTVDVLPDLAEGLRSFYEVGCELRTIVSDKTDKLKRFAASLAILEKIGTMTLTAASTMKFFKSMGLAKGCTIQAIPIVAAVSVVLMSIPEPIVNVVKLSKALYKLDRIAKGIENEGGKDTLQKIVTLAGDEKLLEKNLRLSKVAIRQIKARVDAFGKSSDDNANEGLEEVFRVLRGRARLALGFEAASLAAKIAGAVGVVLLVTPGIFAGAALVGVSAAGLVGVGVGRICTFDTDPFAKKSTKTCEWDDAEEVFEQGGECAKHVVTGVDQFHKMPEKVSTIVEEASDLVMGVADSSFLVRDVVKQIRIIFRSRVGALIRFGATCKILEHVGTMVESVSALVKFAQLLNIIPAALAPCVPFIPFIGIAASIFGAVPLGIYSVARSSVRVYRLNHFSKELAGKNANQEEILQRVCKYLEDQKIKKLAKNLYLSPEAQEMIEQRIDNLTGKPSKDDVEQAKPPVDKAQAVLAMVEVVTKLRNRSRVILAYDCVDLLSKLVGAVGSVFLATPLAPVGAGLVAASAAGSGGALAGQLLFLKDNPLDGESRMRVVRAWNAVKRKIPHFHGAAEAA